MTTIQIPLDKNPDVAALVGDKQPGDKIYGCFTIKSQDAQTLELRIEEMADNPSELPKPDEYSDDDEDAEDGGDDEEGETKKSPEGSEGEPKPAQQPGSMGRQLASKLQDAGDSGF